MISILYVTPEEKARVLKMKNFVRPDKFPAGSYLQLGSGVMGYLMNPDSEVKKTTVLVTEDPPR